VPGETRCDPIADAVAGLAHIPAGPGLAAALASVDLKGLTGSQCVDVVKARYRQASHERGQLFAVIAEVMHRGEADSPAFAQWPGEFAADEVRAALVLTRRAAENLCVFAEDLVRRLPAVQQALAAGVIDQPRGPGVQRVDQLPGPGACFGDRGRACQMICVTISCRVTS